MTTLYVLCLSNWVQLVYLSKMWGIWCVIGAMTFEKEKTGKNLCPHIKHCNERKCCTCKEFQAANKNKSRRY